MSKQPEPTAALVIETNNLRGSDLAAVVDPLTRLLEHLAHQTRPLTSLDAVVITHDGLPPEARDRVERATAATLQWVELPRDTGYYEAKNLGFAATQAGVVAFADGDCWPDPQWLESLLAPFTDPATQVVAGRTTYRPDAIGAAATTIDFNYYPSPLGPGCVKNFYANNVAFRREVFGRFGYVPADRIYRGHCQVLGMRLQQEGIPVLFAPAARTVHRFPDRVRDFLKLRLHRGADARELAPNLAKAVLPTSLRWIGSLGPVSACAVLAPRLAYSLAALGHQDMPAQGRRAAWKSRLWIGAISAMDLVGGLIGHRALASDRARANETLSYQADVDRLTTRTAA